MGKHTRQSCRFQIGFFLCIGVFLAAGSSAFGTVEIEIKDIGIKKHRSHQDCPFFFEIRNRSSKSLDGYIEGEVIARGMFGKERIRRTFSAAVAIEPWSAEEVCLSIPFRSSIRLDHRLLSSRQVDLIL